MTNIQTQEAYNAKLIAELRLMGDSVSTNLAHRMAQCRADRLLRRSSRNRWATTEAMVRTGQYKCKTVACFACRRDHVRRKIEQAADLFSMGDTDNAECSLVTINWSRPCADLDEVTAAHRKFSDDIRNWRNALIKKNRGFSRGTLLAILEVQHDGAMWRPHWHILVHHPRVDRQELRHQLKLRWNDNRQVQVKAFWDTQSASENAAGCAIYALKFDTEAWSISSAAKLHGWIRQRAALRSMTVIIRPKLASKKAVAPHQGCRPHRPSVRSHDRRDEPMPVAFGGGFTLQHSHHLYWSPCNAKPPTLPNHGGPRSGLTGLHTTATKYRPTQDRIAGPLRSVDPHHRHSVSADHPHRPQVSPIKAMHSEEREWGGKNQVGWPRTR
jgi:hypothetical protein